jgi:hypothetical protein
MKSERRFPPPWIKGEHHEADCLCIRSRDTDLRGYIRNVSRRTNRTADGNTSRVR